MKLTPLDIHHKEFHRGLRGYNEEEVDSFLDIVAEEFERLFKENVELNEQLEAVKEKLARFENIEQTLQNTLVSAQKSAEEVQRNAEQKSELVVKEAELKAREMLQGVQGERQRLAENFQELTRSESEFRNDFKAMLVSYLRRIEEIEAQAPAADERRIEDASEEPPKPPAGGSDTMASMEQSPAGPSGQTQPVPESPRPAESTTSKVAGGVEVQPENPAPQVSEQPTPIADAPSLAQLQSESAEPETDYGDEIPEREPEPRDPDDVQQVQENVERIKEEFESLKDEFKPEHGGNASQDNDVRINDQNSPEEVTDIENT